MSANHRPWWLFAMQMPLLDTVLREDHRPGQKRFIVEGKPVIKNLSWITYGPVAAVLAMLVVGALTWLLEVNDQSKTIKLAFVCLLGATPVVAWLLAGGVIGKIGQIYLERQIKANTQQALITLNLNEKSLQLNEAPSIPFADIAGFKLISDSGVYYDPAENVGSMVNLIMETKQGQITLLPKELGVLKQKLQLISQLKAMLEIGD